MERQGHTGVLSRNVMVDVKACQPVQPLLTLPATFVASVKYSIFVGVTKCMVFEAFEKI